MEQDVNGLLMYEREENHSREANPGGIPGALSPQWYKEIIPFPEPISSSRKHEFLSKPQK